jgi:xanthine permease XanP
LEESEHIEKPRITKPMSASVRRELKRKFYPIEAKLTPFQIVLFGFQHVLSMFVGIVTPPLVVSSALGLKLEDSAFLVSMALLASGIGTLVQVHGIGPVGSRMLCVQGTSFTFVPVAIAAGQAGGLSLMFGLTALCAPVEVILSRSLSSLRRWFPPVVTGTVVTLIGCSLIGIGMTDLAGGFGSADLGAPANLGLGLGVLVVILWLGGWKEGKFASISIGVGLVLGYLVALAAGFVDLSAIANEPNIRVPQPLAYGLSIDPILILPWAVAYVVSALETMGDLTATSKVSREPVDGPLFQERIEGGIAGDGVGSLIAGALGSLPTTSFSQNNGVIKLTGVASRSVGYGVGGILIVLALFPKLGAILSLMPKPVLGGATVLMFATVAVAGLNVASGDGLTPRKEKILAVSLALGLGVSMVPDATAQLSQLTNPILRSFGVLAQSGLAIGTITAVIMNRVLPPD